MQNVEFKAEIRDLEAARRQCGLVGARRAGSFAQVDTYFRIPDGRLKRRVSTPIAAATSLDNGPVAGTIEWIYYRRPDAPAARVSNYTILSDAQARVRYGEGTLLPWKIVRKTREVWIVDNVRIHLDHVDGLGFFIEFEAVVSPRFDAAECRMMVVYLRDAFAPILGEPIGGSYESLTAELPENDRSQPLP